MRAKTFFAYNNVRMEDENDRRNYFSQQPIGVLTRRWEKIKNNGPPTWFEEQEDKWDEFGREFLHRGLMENLGEYELFLFNTSGDYVRVAQGESFKKMVENLPALEEELHQHFHKQGHEILKNVTSQGFHEGRGYVVVNKRHGGGRGKYSEFKGKERELKREIVESPDRGSSSGSSTHVLNTETLHLNFALNPAETAKLEEVGIEVKVDIDAQKTEIKFVNPYVGRGRKPHEAKMFEALEKYKEGMNAGAVRDILNSASGSYHGAKRQKKPGKRNVAQNHYALLLPLLKEKYNSIAYKYDKQGLD
jgi:hypothetical protein